MKQKLGELTPKTYNSYTDSHGRTIIPDYKNRRAYIVTKEEEKKHYVLTNRYSIVIAVIMLGGFYWSWTWGIIIGVVLLALSEGYYRMSFLPSLQTVDDVEFPKAKGIAQSAKEMPSSRRILFLLMLVAFAILIVVNMFLTIKDWNNVWTFSDMNDVILVIFTIGACAMSSYMAVQVFLVVIGRK